MTRKKHYLSLFVLACAALAIQACAPKSQEDCGFVQNVYGQRISWKGALPVVLKIHQDVPKQYVPAIQAAANTWNAAAGKTLFEIRDDGTHLPTGRDHANIIYFSPTWDAGRASEQAKTSVHWIGDQIQEADVRINGSGFKFYTQQHVPNAISMEALILHEMGHILGLKHKDADQSVMGTYLASNTDRTQLAGTDMSSLSCEY